MFFPQEKNDGHKMAIQTKHQTWRPIIWCKSWFYVLGTSLKDLIVKKLRFGHYIISFQNNYDVSNLDI